MKDPATRATHHAHPKSNRTASAGSKTDKQKRNSSSKEKRSSKKLVLPGVRSDTRTIHQDVVAALRTFIIRGELKPGVRLPERALCERLKVSRTPLRESLRVLANEGLVDLLPTRGARVAKLTPTDLQHLFETLKSLEATAGKLACERATEAEITEIRAIHRRMFTFFLAHRMPEYLDLNRMIHNLIVQAAHNPILESTYASLSNRLLWACAVSNELSERRWEAAMNEHEQIIQALEQRAGDCLATLLEWHLANKYQALNDKTLARKH